MEVILKHTKKDVWSQLVKYPGCFTGLGSYWTRAGNRYTGLTDEDARRLEKAIGYQEFHLAPNSKFWDTFMIRITEKPYEMNTNIPEFELQYLFAKNHKRVATSSLSVRPQHDFLLINQDHEAEEINKRSKVKRLAFAEFNKMSIEEMRKCLRVFGKKSDNISNELVESTLFDIIESTPEKFLSLWVDNKNKDTQYIIEAAIAKNIIRKSRNIYYYGTDVIGRSLEDVIAQLNDLSNQDIKLAIMQEIESK